jgi:small subunit ribosomal protein S8
MTMTDPIADFLTRIRNANLVRHDLVVAPSSKIKKSIAEILKAEGFIGDYEEVNTENKQGELQVSLKYGPNKERVITGLKRISKPGLRVYAKSDSIPKVLNGMGIAIISTSEGLLTDRQAREKKIGGEIVAYVW